MRSLIVSKLHMSSLSTKFSSLLESEFTEKWSYKWNIDWIKMAQSILIEKFYYSNPILRFLMQSKQIRTVTFWILIFKGREFNRRGCLTDKF